MPQTSPSDISSPHWPDPPAQPTAGVLVDPGQIAYRPIERAAPGPDEIRVRLEGSGVCASNIPAFQGREWFDYPFEPGHPGHEGWGIVEAVGSEVEQFDPGDRAGIIGNGAYATHTIAAANACVRLPEELDDRPFPAEPLACLMNIYRRSEIEAGDTVAVVGSGFLGCLLCQLASQEGARVAALSRRQFSREMAARCGAEATFRIGGETDPASTVADWADGKGCDVVIEATGKEAPLQLAGDLCRIRGRLVVAGYHQDGLRRIDMQTWNWRGLDVINAHERDTRMYVRGAWEAIDAVLDDRLDPYRLFTHQYPFDQLEDALRLAAERPDGFMKALVMTDPDGPS